MQQAPGMLDVFCSLKLHEGIMVNMMDVDSMCRSKSWKYQKHQTGFHSRWIGQVLRDPNDLNFASRDGNAKLLRSAVLSTSLRNTKLCPCCVSSGVLTGFQCLMGCGGFQTASCSVFLRKSFLCQCQPCG